MSAKDVGRSFGRAAADYERGRPEWPEDVLDLVPVSADAEVLDLAAGTGKLTRLLARRYRTVLAVEPDDRMRAALTEASAIAGTAEEIPLSPDSVDAVFVGDAFHWFDARAALREIARVLRPRGALVLLWNIWAREGFDPPIPPAAIEALEGVYIRAGRPGGPRYETGAWREAFAGSAFEPLREEVMAYEVELSRAQLVSLWLSVSSVASLPKREHGALAELLRGLLSERYRLKARIDVWWTLALT